MNELEQPLLRSSEVKTASQRKYTDENMSCEKLFDEMHKNNVDLDRVRRISEMKSKLPESHLPSNQHKDANKHENLIEKIQALHLTDKDESKAIEECKGIEPKFLVIDSSEISLEELAMIDAELENDSRNPLKREESLPFVRVLK